MQKKIGTKRQYADPKEKVTYYRAKGVLEELEYIKDFKEELKRIFKLTEEEVSTLFIIGEKIKSVKEPHLETYLSEM